MTIGAMIVIVLTVTLTIAVMVNCETFKQLRSALEFQKQQKQGDITNIED